MPNQFYSGTLHTSVCKKKHLTLYHNVVNEGVLSLHRWKNYMRSIHKNLAIFIALGIMAYGFPVMAICSSNCAAGNPDPDSTMDGNCPFLYHPYFQMVILLSALSALPFAGHFFGSGRLFLPPGVYLPLFRPPRFSC